MKSDVARAHDKSRAGRLRKKRSILDWERDDSGRRGPYRVGSEATQEERAHIELGVRRLGKQRLASSWELGDSGSRDSH